MRLTTFLILYCLYYSPFLIVRRGGTNTSLVSVVGDIFKNAKQNNNFLKMISSNESSSEKTSKELEKLLQQSFLELERYLQCMYACIYVLIYL